MRNCCSVVVTSTFTAVRPLSQRVVAPPTEVAIEEDYGMAEGDFVHDDNGAHYGGEQSLTRGVLGFGVPLSSGCTEKKFGAIDVDVWMNCVRFEAEIGPESVDAPVHTIGTNGVVVHGSRDFACDLGVRGDLFLPATRESIVSSEVGGFL